LGLVWFNQGGCLKAFFQFISLDSEPKRLYTRMKRRNAQGKTLEVIHMFGNNDTVDPMESVKRRYQDGLKQLVKEHVLTAAEIPGMMKKSDEEWAAVERAQKRQDEIAREATMQKYEAGRRPFVITGTQEAPAPRQTVEARLSASSSPTNDQSNVVNIDRKNVRDNIVDRDVKNDRSNIVDRDVKWNTGNVQGSLEKSRIPGL
jgi:hypothetical protein